MIPKIRTTITPLDSSDEPQPRASLAVYLGDAVISTTLLTLDEPARCDRCGQELALMVEADVDEDGGRHVGDCPPDPEPTLAEAG